LKQKERERVMKDRKRVEAKRKCGERHFISGGRGGRKSII
jgi:hypothetical protein